MEGQGILISTYVENITTRKDKTVKITLGSQELTPEKAGQMFQLLNQLAVTYICPKEISQNEIDLVDKVSPEMDGKSQSQRMRNVIYLLFKQNPEGFKTFDDFYRNKTDAVIEHFKGKLQPF